MNFRMLAQNNLSDLRSNPYPGRGIVLGVSEDDHLCQIYWIMGRSEDSRNRRFGVEGGRVYTDVADSAKPAKNPELTLYNAMSEEYGCFIVSNGRQTDTVLQAMGVANDANLTSMTEMWGHEPDAPNHTSRITGIWDAGTGVAELAMIRKSTWGKTSDRLLWQYEEIEAGFGFCITTYSGNGDPLPPFRSEPLLLPISGGIDVVAERYWDVLDSDNRVSLAVKFVGPDNRSKVKVINAYEKK